MSLIEPLKEYDAFLIDLDGVIYLRHSLIANADKFVEALRSEGRKFAFLTNNSSRTRDEYVKTLGRFGIDVSRRQIVTSAYATCQYLIEKSPGGGRVYVVGEEGLRSELKTCGFQIVDEVPVDYVVVGIDFHFNYEKLKGASRLIRSGARFISTNRDATYPTEKGLYPGAGSVVSAIQTASGKRPLNIGKPSRRIFELSAKMLGVPPKRTVVVGDRYETDIIGGAGAGMGTTLILSGVATRAEAETYEIRPDVVVQSVGHLLA